MNVLPLSRLDADGIKLSNIITIHERGLKIVKVSQRQADVCYQSFTHYLCYPPNTDKFGNINVTLSVKDDNEEDLDHIFNFEASVYSKLESSILDNNMKRTRIDMANLERRTLRIKARRDVVVGFDASNTPVNLCQFRAFDRVRCIIRPEHVWISKDCYGIMWSLLQIKDLDYISLPITCLFEDNAKSVSSEDDARYKRMIKMGVPLGAIEQKMLMDGYTVELAKTYSSSIVNAIGICSIKNGSVTGKIPPPPPLPPPPPPLPFANAVQKHVVGRPEFLNDIERGNFKLRSKDTERSTKIVNKTQSAVDKTKGFAPSLDDILMAKTRLKVASKKFISR